MKFRNIEKWDNPSDSKGLLFFAQLLEELLFDYSLDTYKPSVMHVGLLCSEAINTIKEIERGVIKAPNIWHVTYELCSCYDKDPIARNLVDLNQSGFVAILKNKTKKLGELKTVLEILALHWTPERYKQENERLLVAEVLGEASFAQIRRLTRNYVTTLIATGYHPKHIYDHCLKFFFYGSNRIDGPAAITEFCSYFSKDSDKYRVLFRTNRSFDGLDDILTRMKMFVSRTTPSDFDLSKYPEFKHLGENELYVIVDDVLAKDVYSARNHAEKRLKFISTLLTIYHHKEPPGWLSECVTYNSSTDSYKKNKKPINAMHKCLDLTQAVATKRLALLLNEFSMENDSFIKFARCAQLHALSIDSQAEENQILNLWIALESLVPSESKDENDSNIEHIANSLTPFLCIGYIESLINNLVKDMLRWNSRSIRELLRPVEGRKLVDKLARVLILEEYRDQYQSLLEQTREFYLLQDRIEHIKQILSSPAIVASTIDTHKQRLEWQIRRIYRTRNIIVHSGTTPSYTRTLIEHTHSYLDVVLSVLIKLASKPKSINSVPQGFKFIEIQFKSYKAALEKKGQKFDGSNIDNLLFNRPN